MNEQSAKGFTIIEVLVATFVIGVVVVAIFGMFFLSTGMAQGSEKKIAATAIAKEKMEQIIAMPYPAIGTVDGYPEGSLVADELVNRNGIDYNVHTNISYVDDSFDATAGEGDSSPDDFKQVTVRVSWNGIHEAEPVVLSSYISPEESEFSDGMGGLLVIVRDASGVPLSGANVHVQSSTISPAFDETLITDSSGRAFLANLPAASQEYDLMVSKDGYTSEQTLSESSDFFPDFEHSRITILEAQRTERTIVIDQVADVTLHIQNEAGVSVTSAPLTITGTKTTGKNAAGEPVHLFKQTITPDVSGNITLTDMVWDSLVLIIDSSATGYDIKESDVPLPFVLNPGNDKEVTVTLTEHTDNSLHVTVVDPAGNAIEGASVEVIQDADTYNEVTGLSGQVFFSDISAAEASILIEKDGYHSLEEATNVSGTSDRLFIMSAL